MSGCSGYVRRVSHTVTAPFFFDTVVSISIVEQQHRGSSSFCQSCAAKTYTPGSSGLRAKLTKLTVSSHTLKLPGLQQQLHNVNVDVLKV